MFRRLCCIISILLVCACKIELHTNLNEIQANKIVAVLLGHGIAVDKRLSKDGIDVWVEEARFAEAVEILEYNGLPSQEVNALESLFPSDGLVSSPIQEWVRLNYARAKELGNTISKIPGIIEADVHIAEQPDGGPFVEQVEPTVSVSVLARRDRVSESLIPEIKNLVAFSIPGIAYDNVNIVISPVDIELDEDPNEVFLGLVMQRSSADTLRDRLLYTAYFLGGLVAVALATFVVRRRRRGMNPVDLASE